MLKIFKRLFLENRNTRQTVFKNMFWLSFGQIAGRLIRAAVIIYAARVLGAADYGVFSYALGLAAFFTIFADVGINSILTREVSQRPTERSQYFATALWIKFGLLLFTTVLVVFVAPLFSKIEAARTLIPFVALLTIFDGVREFANSFLRALERMELEALVNTVTNIAITTAGFIILSFSPTAYSLTMVYALAGSIGAFLAVLLLWKEFRDSISNVRRSLLRPLVTAALPIAVLGLLGAFMLNTDMIMLGWWRTPEELGFYSSAQKIVQVLYTLPGILAAALFPVFSRLVGQARHDTVRTLIERALTATFLVALPLTVGGIVLATPIMALLYGAEYVPGATAFQFLIATTLLVFPGALIGNLVIAYNKQKSIVWGVALGSTSNIAFNALLIPPLGIMGAAIATVIAQSMSNGYMWYIIRKTNRFETLLHLTKIVGASVSMGVCAFILNLLGLHVLVTIVVSGLIYLGALVLFREHVIAEIRALATSFRS
jgi:O-antigen/teichoic acid export membrane protein